MPAAAGRLAVAGGGGAVGLRQVVIGASRGRRGAAPRRSERLGAHPGSQPDGGRSATLAPRRGATVVVDQCEELFTLCVDEAERRSFVDRLVAWARAGTGGPVPARRPRVRPLVVSRARPPCRARSPPPRRHVRTGPAGRHRGTRAARVTGRGAGPGRRPRGRGLPPAGLVAAHVARPRGDVAAARGTDAHAGRVPRLRWDARGGRPVGRAGLRAGVRRAEDDAAGPDAAARPSRSRWASRYAAGCPVGWW